MDLSDIQLIKAIAEIGSISGASQALHLSQPTVSKRLSRLEQTLGMQLFHRLSRGMAPTSTAEYILSQEPDLNNHMQAIKRQVQRMADLEAGHLRLGVGPIIEQVLLPEVLSGFLTLAGAAQITVVTEDDRNLIEQFASSELDVIVGPFEASDTGIDELIELNMLSEPMIAVTRPEHPLVGHNEVSIESAVGYQWAAPRPTANTNDAAALTILPRVKLFSDNYPLLIRAALTVDLICVGPRSVFAAELSTGALQQIPLDLGVHWRSTLLTRPEAYLTPLISHIGTLFQRTADQLNRNTE